MTSGAGTTDAGSPDAKERQLCLKCLAPNQTAAHFCAECGAPLTSYAATGPLESVFAEGHLYRQAVEKPRSLIVVVGIWLLFGTTAISGVIPLFDVRDIGIPGIIMSGLFLPICAMVIWKTTSRYLLRPKPSTG